MLAAVEEVDAQADDQPAEKAQPGDDRQAGHEQHAKEDAQNGYGNAARGAEATTPVRFAIAQDQHADRYQHKGKEGTDIRQVGQGADVQQSTGNGHHKTCHQVATAGVR